MFGVLVKAQLVPVHWTVKPVEEIEAKSSDPGLMIKVTLNEYSTSCVLDTGATFTLIPYQVWKNLKINASCLNTKVTFNINSALIGTSGNFPARVSAELPSNISPNPSEVISKVSEVYDNF